MLGLVLLLVGSVAADKHVHDRPVESDGSGHVHCELAMLGHDFEDECAGELGARSDDGDGDLSYLSSDDAAYLADSALT